MLWRMCLIKENNMKPALILRRFEKVPVDIEKYDNGIRFEKTYTADQIEFIGFIDVEFDSDNSLIIRGNTCLVIEPIVSNAIKISLQNS